MGPQQRSLAALGSLVGLEVLWDVLWDWKSCEKSCGIELEVLWSWKDGFGKTALERWTHAREDASTGMLTLRTSGRPNHSTFGESIRT